MTKRKKPKGYLDYLEANPEQLEASAEKIAHRYRQEIRRRRK